MSQTIRTIITEDEYLAQELLLSMLADHFPQLEVVAVCSDLASCIEAIRLHRPALVFLDIEMPGGKGTQLLNQLEESEKLDLQVIFITAYSEYALQALKQSAVDYILKPLQLAQLREAIWRLEQRLDTQVRLQRLETLQNSLNGTRLTVVADGQQHILETELITYLKADGAYTEIFSSQRPKVYVSKKIKYFEQILTEELLFYRVHRSYLVNTRYVRSLSPTVGLSMYDGSILPVTRERFYLLDDFIKRHTLK